MNKINLYVFSQIVKSCTLVFFIFVSIAWLMQLSRLFSIMNNLQIKFIDIFGLSIWLIPNLTNVTLPFVIIFGLVLAFLKLDKDREIIAIYSLGLSLKEIRKPIILLISFSILLYLSLNFIISPITYNIYKQKEFSLRNTIEFDKINISMPKSNIFQNVNNRAPKNIDDLKENLLNQLIYPVQWSNTMKSINKYNGIIIECGPSKVLSGIAKSNDMNNVYSTSSETFMEDIKGIL